VLPSDGNRQNPPVKSIVRRQPGAKRSMRFILYGSAWDFFEKLARQQNEAAAPAKEIL
jgi:hypothetical protein